MAAIQDAGALSALIGAGSTAGTAPAKGSVEDVQQRFLQLLVTQMRNQDPLNPMDNAQVTTQLAQLNTVSGISQLNTTLQQLLASYTATQSLQAAALIGRGVLVEGSNLQLANGQAVFGMQLPQAADSVTVTVQDAAGHVVHTMNVGAQNAGTALLQWDGATDAGGTAPPGTYRFSVKATAGGTDIAATALSFGKVLGVATDPSGAKISVDGQGALPLSSVKEII